MLVVTFTCLVVSSQVEAGGTQTAHHSPSLHLATKLAPKGGTRRLSWNKQGRKSGPLDHYKHISTKTNLKNVSSTRKSFKCYKNLTHWAILFGS